MVNVFSSVIFITVAVVLGYGTLEWLQIPKGTLTDWIVGLVSCWWLIVVVVMPWNVHFSAKEVLDEIRISRQRNMKIDPENEIYAQKITKRYLIIAISLHIISAIGLALLTFFNITVIGYWGAIVALLLMGLRPAVRLQAYIVSRLSSIKQTTFYPREDTQELRSRFYEMESRLNSLDNLLDMNTPSSFISKLQNNIKHQEDILQRMRVKVEDNDVKNKAEHEQISRSIEEGISKLSEDTKFLGQVRDLVKFIKNA